MLFRSYEIGDPRAYILPDVVCNFTNVTMEELGSDRVLVRGAKGLPPTDTYKVSATYLKGYRISIAVIIAGIKAAEKAQVSAEAIIKKTQRIFSENGWSNYIDKKISIIGTEVTYGDNARPTQPREVLLRIMATHEQKEALILLSREIGRAHV